jgi:2-oxoglutarate ferredoxin oxidoreductase subunit alpha
MMVEKRARKFLNIANEIEPPALEGPEDAEVTLIGWGSTYGVIKEAIELLKLEGVTANHLQLRWIVPFHAQAVTDILSRSKRTIVVENNFSGQFYRYLRSETGLSVNGHIRKYDGEPFAPHHIADGVLEQLAGKTDRYVPFQEVIT